MYWLWIVDCSDDVRQLSSAHQGTAKRWTHQPLIGWLAGTLTKAEVLFNSLTRRHFRFTEGARQVRAVVTKSIATYPDLQPQNGVMAPLPLPLSWLLKRADCLHKANTFWNGLHGSHQRQFTSRWCKWNVGSQGKNHAASPYSSSSGDSDVTDDLWCVYNKTKRQTEGKNYIQQTPYIH